MKESEDLHNKNRYKKLQKIERKLINNCAVESTALKAILTDPRCKSESRSLSKVYIAFSGSMDSL